MPILYMAGPPEAVDNNAFTLGPDLNWQAIKDKMNQYDILVGKKPRFEPLEVLRYRMIDGQLVWVSGRRLRKIK